MKARWLIAAFFLFGFPPQARAVRIAPGVPRAGSPKTAWPAYAARYPNLAQAPFFAHLGLDASLPTVLPAFQRVMQATDFSPSAEFEALAPAEQAGRLRAEARSLAERVYAEFASPKPAATHPAKDAPLPREPLGLEPQEAAALISDIELLVPMFQESRRSIAAQLARARARVSARLAEAGRLLDKSAEPDLPAPGGEVYRLPHSGTLPAEARLAPAAKAGPESGAADSAASAALPVPAPPAPEPPPSRLSSLTRAAYQRALAPFGGLPKVGDWLLFGRRWRKAYEEHNRLHGDAVESFLKADERGDPQAKTLRELGFRFDRAARRKVKIPSFATLAANYERLLQAHIAAGRLKEADSIRPGRAFRSQDGTLHFIDHRSTPRLGWTELELAGDPKLFGKMLRAGFFPTPQDDTVHHDLAHWTGLLEHPEYMAALRWLFQKPAPGEERPTGYDAYQRYLYIVENLSLVPAGRREALRARLSYPFKYVPDAKAGPEGVRDGGPAGQGAASAEGVVVTVLALEKHLERSFPETLDGLDALSAHARRIVAAYDENIVHYGGTGRELGWYGYGRHPEVRHSLSTLGEEARVLAEDAQTRTLERRRKLLAAVARLEVGLWESTKLGPAEFIREAARARPGVDSKLYEMFVLSGMADDAGFEGRDGRWVEGPGLMSRSISRGLTDEDTRLFTFASEGAYGGK